MNKNTIGTIDRRAFKNFYKETVEEIKLAKSVLRCPHIMATAPGLQRKLIFLKEMTTLYCVLVAHSRGKTHSTVISSDFQKSCYIDRYQEILEPFKICQ